MRLIRPLSIILGLTPSLAFAQMSQAAGYDNSTSPLRVVFGLVIVLGVIGAFAWLMKRFNHSKIGGHSVAKIVGGVSLGSRERLVVVELAGHWIVTGVTPGSINSLGSFKISEIERASSNTISIANDQSIVLEKSEEPEVHTAVHSDSPIVSKNDRFRFESRPVVEEVQPVERVVAMANPVLTEIFKRLLKK
jgi:flagellar biosynthetic protein FliO